MLDTLGNIGRETTTLKRIRVIHVNHQLEVELSHVASMLRKRSDPVGINHGDDDDDA